jgi:transcriptional regulator
MPAKPKKSITVREIQDAIVPKLRDYGLSDQQIAASLGTTSRGLSVILAEQQRLEFHLDAFLAHVDPEDDA